MLRDEQKREKEKLKGRPFSEKLIYFLAYNKFAIGAAVIGVILISWIAFTIASFDPNKLYVVITDQQGGGLQTELLDSCWEKTSANDLRTVYSTDMELAFTDNLNDRNAADIQKILALYSSRTIDVYIGPQAAVDKYGPEGMFLPLDTLIGTAFSQEEWDALAAQDRIVYVTLLDYSGEDPVPSDETIPAAIRIPQSSLYQTAGMNIDAPCIGVTYNSTRPDEAIAYLKMFLD